MKWVRKLFGLDFPDPAVGQVWRSRHSGRAFRVTSVGRSDSGYLWEVGVHVELGPNALNPVGMTRYYCPRAWRAMLREECRVLTSAPLVRRHQPPYPMPPSTPPLISSTAQPSERKHMEDSITITKADLKRGLAQWEQMSRDGNWQDQPGTVDEVSTQNADHLWELLTTQPVAA
jgi:hypothetical protein